MSVCKDVKILASYLLSCPSWLILHSLSNLDYQMSLKVWHNCQNVVEDRNSFGKKNPPKKDRRATSQAKPASSQKRLEQTSLVFKRIASFTHLHPIIILPDSLVVDSIEKTCSFTTKIMKHHMKRFHAKILK